jgi:asparagine synthase (glutamine-hydrolysing)
VDRAGRRYYERCDASDPLDRALYQDIKMYLADDILALTDRIGMWHSLELRVPFLDHTLLEFCARIPTNLKIRFGEKKHLLRRAAAPFIPASVLNHRKQGFASPMAMWMRGGLKDFVGRNLSPSCLNDVGVLNPPAVTALMDAHEGRLALNDRQVFAVLMFQRWSVRRMQSALATTA